MASFLSNLEWRYATKRFDPTRKVPADAMDTILHAIRMAPTSYGLQPFYVVTVTDDATKAAMGKAGWDQPQFTTASHLLVFVARSHVSQRVRDYFHVASGGDAEARARMSGYEAHIARLMAKMSPAESLAWAQRQAYIALGFAMAACAELAIDSCALEGFVPEELDRILALPHGEHATVVLALGYRDPSAKQRPKTRFPHDDLFR